MKIACLVKRFCQLVYDFRVDNDFIDTISHRPKDNKIYEITYYY